KKLILSNKLPISVISSNTYPKSFFKNVVEKDYLNKFSKITEQVGVNVYKYELNQKIDWEIYNDTLTINNVLCTKAYTNYEGREYYAWFSPDFPIQDGPYKFWGLPGLIFKIHDFENHFSFSVEKIENCHNCLNPSLLMAKKPINVSYEKFKQLKKEALENPIKDMQGVGFYVESINGEKIGDTSPQHIKKEINSIERY
ncbi:MAG: GLPGLI family protein, partial [Runella sp.]